jgi:hypothetical protein
MVVECSFGWLNRFRRLTRADERLPEILGGLHFVFFVVLVLVHAVSHTEKVITSSSEIFMASHNFSYKEVTDSVCVTPQNDGWSYNWVNADREGKLAVARARPVSSDRWR